MTMMKAVTDPTATYKYELVVVFTDFTDAKLLVGDCIMFVSTSLINGLVVGSDFEIKSRGAGVGSFDG